MNLEPYLALEASAGSGKTFALSVRYLSLLFLGANPQKIVALTFTNKSAAEMKSRIFETLKHLEHKDELHAISEQTGMPPEILLQKRTEVMQKVLQSDIKISTLDAFFATILRHFALNVGLSPDFKIDQRLVEESLVERFIGHCKKENLYDALIGFSICEDKKLGDIFDLLDFLYQKKTEFDLSTLPQGSMKPLAPILAILEEIKSEFSRLGLGEKALDTFNATNLSELLSKKFLAKDDFYYWSYAKFANEKTNALLDTLKEALKNYCRERENYFLGVLGQLFGIYVKTLHEINTEYAELSFNDVTNLLYTLLHEEIHKDFLYFRLDGVIEHLLIDEFQDTSVVQYEILLPIIDEIRSGIGIKESKTLFFVGDIKQSIYRFRGGTKALFNYAKQSLKLNVNSLDTNYRSTKHIVNFVNEIFLGKIEGYEPQKVPQSQEEGYVKVFFNDEIHTGALKAIETLLDKGIKANEIAILVHTNKDAQALKEYIHEQLPFLHVRLEATLKLIDVRSIRALICLLKYLYFGDDLFRAEFLVLNGRRWDEVVDRHLFDRAMPPLPLLQKVITHFELFHQSADMLRFLEIASRYDDLESFLFAMSDLSDESKNEDEEGLRILTVHKSKGLEFDHVIVCDKLSKDNHRSDTILYTYNDVEIDGIHMTMAGREAIDPLYARAKDKERLLMIEDRLNALYVALTRGKRSLFVCAKPQESVFEMLGLFAFEKGEIVRSTKEIPSVQSPLNVYHPRRYGTQEILQKDEENEAYEMASITFGIALHYLLEMLDSFNEEALNRAYMALQNRYAPLLSQEVLSEIYARVEKLLKCPLFQTFIDGAKIYKEQPLIYQQERKQIDLLLEFEDKIIIIDYKSSTKGEVKHHEQVKAYKEALHQIYALPVEGYICYLKHDAVEWVKNL